MHKALVAGSGASIELVDHWLRWVDVPRPKWQQYLSWVMNAAFFPRLSEYDLIVLEGFQVPGAIMKWMRRLRPHQRVVCHHVGEQAYFLENGFYSKSTAFGMRKMLGAYDAHICVGVEQTRLVKTLVPGADSRIYSAYCTHVGREKFDRFQSQTPSLDSRSLLFVGNIYSDWRVLYKGLDLLLAAFDVLARRDSSVSLTVIGIEADHFARLAKDLPPQVSSRITVVPHADDLGPAFAAHSLLVVPARGDAFPTVVLEGIAAGLPPMLSTATGNKEVAARISPELVVPLDARAWADRITWYLDLPPSERAALSASARAVAADFTEEHGVSEFKRVLSTIYSDAGLDRRANRGS